MKTAPVTELKASLSRFLAAVKAGEEVVVTERGRPIATISPIAPSVGDEEERLHRLAAKGVLRIGKGKFPPGFWDVALPADPEGEVLKALLEEREEGR
jgi:prevent-host-death family protein